METIPFLTMYKELIATPSISSSSLQYDLPNRELIALLATWCESLGFKITIEDVAPGKQNLIAIKSPQGTAYPLEGGLMLSGHSDTVAFDPSLWESDPFVLTEKEDKFYGLGTADMKGFFAFILQTVQMIDWKSQKKPLYIVATCDEETSMAGVRHLVMHSNCKPDCCIIGEPTSLTPVYAHKGHMANAVRVTGRSGHSSDPTAGINAIEIMQFVIEELLKLQRKLAQDYNHLAFQIPYPTLNLGHIHGGENPNTICGCCELHFDLRPLPGMSLQTMELLCIEALQSIIERWPDAIEIEALHEPIPGYECSKESVIVQEIQSLSGKKAETVNYCTEAPFLQQLCPTVVIGPGSITQAHQPNEYLAQSYYTPTIEMLTKLIQRYCF